MTVLAREGRARALACGAAVLGVVLVLTLRDLALPWLRATFIIHVPTILLASWFGGLGPGPDGRAVPRAHGTLTSILSELLVRARTKLEAALRSREALIATMSHELENPLDVLQLEVTRLDR